MPGKKEIGDRHRNRELWHRKHTVQETRINKKRGKTNAKKKAMWQKPCIEKWLN
jgi:hypothetical protein